MNFLPLAAAVILYSFALQAIVPHDVRSPDMDLSEASTGNDVDANDRSASIRETLQGIETAFSALDLKRWLSYFYRSFVIIAPEGVLAPSSESEAIEMLRPHLEALRARGYSKSEIHQMNVKLLSDTTALASVEWVRLKADGSELERLAATYALFKDGQSWKVVMLTVHPPDTLPTFR